MRPPAHPPPAGGSPWTCLSSSPAAPATSCLAEGGGPLALQSAASETRRCGLCTFTPGLRAGESGCWTNDRGASFRLVAPGQGPFLHPGEQHLDGERPSVIPPDECGEKKCCTNSRISSPVFSPTPTLFC